jgi:hypothetical protein
MADSTIVWATVELEDLRVGLCKHPRRCAMALAVNRQLKTDYQADMGSKQVNILRFWRMIGGCGLPNFAQNFVSRFDNSQLVEPFAVMLRLPTESIREDAHLAGISVQEWHNRTETAQRVTYFLAEFDPRYGKSKTTV